MSIEVDRLSDAIHLRPISPDKILQMSIVDKYGSSYTVTLTAEQRDRLVAQLTAI